MKLYPFKSISISTPFSKEEIVTKLSSIITGERMPLSEMIKNYRSYDETNRKPYEGNLSENSFEISRVAGFKNSFRPVIKGNMTETKNGTIVYIQFEIHKAIKTKISVMIGFVSLFCLGVSFYLIKSVFLGGNDLEPAWLIPFGLLIFAYYLPKFLFQKEVQISEYDLWVLFEE